MRYTIKDGTTVVGWAVGLPNGAVAYGVGTGCSLDASLDALRARFPRFEIQEAP